MSKKKKKFRSGFEEKLAKNLEVLKIPFEYEKKKIKYVVQRTYVLDFCVNETILVETKGYFKASDRAKHLLLKEQHPSLDVRFIFMADNKLSKKSKTKYSDWAIKHGFKYCVDKEARVPKEWLKELKKKRKDIL